MGAIVIRTRFDEGTESAKLQRVGLNALSGNLNNTAPSIGTIAGWCSDQWERNITTGLFGLLTVDTPLRLIQQKNHEYQTRLNETRFGPKKKSSPIYLGPKNLDTFWWNCQIIFRCASIHGRAGFILLLFLSIRRVWRYQRGKATIKNISVSP